MQLMIMGPRHDANTPVDGTYTSGSEPWTPFAFRLAPMHFALPRLVAVLSP